MKRYNIPFRGKIRSIPEIAKIVGLHHNTLYNRIYRAGGKITDDIFTKEWHKPRLKSNNGHYIADLAKTYNVPYGTMQKRFHAGYKNDFQLSAKTPNYDKKYGI